MLQMTLHKHFKTLAYMIIQKAKQQGKMKKFDYEHTVVPYFTLFRSKQVQEKHLLAGLTRQHIAIEK